MNKYILTFTLFISFLFVSGQQAELLYDHLSLQDAISIYEGRLEENENDGEAIYNLANAYRLNNESNKAEVWFAKAIESSEETDSKFYYAQMLLMNGKPSEAKEWFSSYKLNVGGIQAEHIDDFITLCHLLETDQVQDKYYQITTVIFNSKKLDFSPSYYGDELLFVSNRNESKGNSSNLDAWTDEKFTDLYVASPKDGYKVKPFSKNINSNLHEGSGVFSKDLNALYFTRSNQIKGKAKNDMEENIRLQIMKTTRDGDKWTTPTKLPLDNSNYSFCHPALSPDNNSMIFASDQPGGYGGMDLYRVEKQGENWGVPENLGEDINTSGNEVFPFIDDENNLYFSSNFHAGFGGLDVFTTEETNGKWKKPFNVGTPLNGVRDDFGVITQDNFKSGYFSSNRTGEDDIYTFINNGKMIINGIVVNCETGEVIPGVDVKILQGENLFKNLISDENGKFSFEVNRGTGELQAQAKKELFKTNEECTGVQIFNTNDREVELSLGLENQIKAGTELRLCGKVLNKDCNYLLDDVKVTVINICNGEEFQITSDKNGNFTLPLIKNCKYRVKAEKGYFHTVEKTFTTDSTMKDCLDLELIMNSTVDLRDPNIGYEGTSQILLKEGTIVDLYNIYFDFDKYYLREDGKEELEWVRKILADYPKMKVEISAHTDSRASSDYNNTLSENRAKSVVNYLINEGIGSDRIVAKGYGESKLKNKCSNGVSCTKLQHQRNRRVEFKVISFEGEVVVSKEWKTYEKE